MIDTCSQNKKKIKRTSEPLSTISLNTNVTENIQNLPQPRGKPFPLLLVHQLSTKEQ